MDGENLLENPFSLMDEFGGTTIQGNILWMSHWANGGRFFLSSQPIWSAARCPTALRGKSRWPCHFGKIIGEKSLGHGKMIGKIIGKIWKIIGRHLSYSVIHSWFLFGKNQNINDNKWNVAMVKPFLIPCLREFAWQLQLHLDVMTADCSSAFR